MPYTTNRTIFLPPFAFEKPRHRRMLPKAILSTSNEDPRRLDLGERQERVADPAPVAHCPHGWGGRAGRAGQGREGSFGCGWGQGQGLDRDSLSCGFGSGAGGVSNVK